MLVRSLALLTAAACLSLTSTAAADPVAAPYVEAAAPAPSATPPPGPRAFLHDGFFLRAAIGAGTLHLQQTAPSDRDDRLTGYGPRYELAIGGTPGKGLTVGGEMLLQQIARPTWSAAKATGEAPSAFLFGLGPFIDWYPNPSGGFHVGATLHLGAVYVADPDGEYTRPLGGVGMLGVSVGHDFWLAPQWSVGIVAKAAAGTVTRSDETRESHFETTKYTATSFALLVDVLYH
jgi:hypothetical protein